MVIWRQVEQEEWLELIEKQVYDLDRRLVQAEDIILRLLAQSKSFDTVSVNEAASIFAKQKQFQKLSMPYTGVNLMMVINLYTRLQNLHQLTKQVAMKNKAFDELYVSLKDTYHYLFNNIERNISATCPLYVVSQEIPNAIIIEKSELQRYSLEEGES